MTEEATLPRLFRDPLPEVLLKHREIRDRIATGQPVSDRENDWFWYVDERLADWKNEGE